MFGMYSATLSRSDCNILKLYAAVVPDVTEVLKILSFHDIKGNRNNLRLKDEYKTHSLCRSVPKTAKF